ncbi:MAG: DUF11 domain-containing protein, partial [Clostridia bacterium]|nr:DUF11 domain-containing protein [Clostridia bacterium]
GGTLIKAGDVIATFATMAPGESQTITAQYTITEADIAKANDTLVNKADVDTDENVSDSDTADTDVVDPSVSIEKTRTNTYKGENASDSDVASGSDAGYLPGETVEFTITVTNDGTVDLTDLIITDVVSNKLTGGRWSYTKKAPVLTEQGNTAVITPNEDGTLTISALATGDAVDLIYYYDVQDATSKTQSDYDKVKKENGNNIFVNDVAVDAIYVSKDIDPTTDKPYEHPLHDEDDADAPLGTVVHDMEIIKEADRTEVVAGDRINYTITVTNTGTTPLTDVVVTDDHDVVIVSGSNLRQGTKVDAGKAVAVFDKLEAGESRVIEVYYTVPKGTEDTKVINTATADSNEVDYREDKAETPIVTPAIAVIKTWESKSPAPANGNGYLPTEQITFTIKVSNTGNVDLTNVKLEDIVSFNLQGGRWAYTSEKTLQSENGADVIVTPDSNGDITLNKLAKADSVRLTYYYDVLDGDYTVVHKRTDDDKLINKVIVTATYESPDIDPNTDKPYTYELTDNDEDKAPLDQPPKPTTTTTTTTTTRPTIAPTTPPVTYPTQAPTTAPTSPGGPKDSPTGDAASYQIFALLAVFGLTGVKYLRKRRTAKAED